MKIKTCQTIRIWPNTEIQTQISGVGTSFSPFSLYNKDFVLEVCQKGAETASLEFLRVKQITALYPGIIIYIF